MIDIHVLTHSGTHPLWFGQCMASLETQPCTVHVVRGIEGSVGAGRAKGYVLGRHEFVGFVDSDDYLLPGCLSACLEGLEKHRSVVTKENVMYLDGTIHKYPKSGHNIAIYRRADVLPYIDAMACTPHTTDMRMRCILRPFQLDFIGYVWRIHNGGDHRNINADVFKHEDAAWQSIA